MSEKKTTRKYCIIPECPNTSKNAPEKLFINVPSDPTARKVWQKAMRREVFVSGKSHVYCCEDHFDVKEDIENYMYLKTMKKGNILIKPNVVPRFFDCQKSRVTAHKAKQSKFLQKKEQRSLIHSLLLPGTSAEVEDVEQEDNVTSETEPKQKDVGIQVLFKVESRSKGIQCMPDDLVPVEKEKKKRKCAFKQNDSKIMRFAEKNNPAP
ncbi:uncharacterized protein LOC126740747 [Anthonomus grandis grandis]|uniref:uncharacterized protein LOC126740747 n=1 Tax=Anthonomus grandis grandis TaxID=2921223 RepID=UPI0021652465|nr:uncharacterized protein LOC126740747 [Anthonomus grandis grandis]